MLNESCIGVNMKEKFVYSWRDVILYNLSVGAQKEELEYVWEKNLKALPTYATIPCAGTFGFIPYHAEPKSPITTLPDTHAQGTLHMSQKLVIKKPLATEAELEIEKVITDVYDRGADKGGVVVMDVIGRDNSGEEVFVNTMQILKGLDGGFGGKPQPKSDIVIPDSEPDIIASDSYPKNTPLLYRLTGDTFALHVDPDFAAKCGFNQPIVHGLCSLGYACRLMIDKLFPGEPERMKSIEMQFRTPAFPEDKFSVHMWNTKPGETLFRMVRDSDGKPILERGRITWE